MKSKSKLKASPFELGLNWLIAHLTALDLPKSRSPKYMVSECALGGPEEE